MLQEYIEEGGNLFLTGQCVTAVDHISYFLEDYMGARTVEDSVHFAELAGIQDDPVGRGLNLLLLGAPGAHNQRRPSVIEPVDTGIEVFHWTEGDNDSYAGVRREYPFSDAKTIFFSFGLEAVSGLGNSDKREDALAAVLDWFDVPHSVEGKTSVLPMSFELFTPYPNPFNGRMNVPLSIERSGVISLKMYDVSGRVVLNHSSLLNAGNNVMTIDANNLGSGMYFIEVENGDVRLRNSVQLLK
jgi:hypothetical protein